MLPIPKFIIIVVVPSPSSSKYHNLLCQSPVSIKISVVKSPSCHNSCSTPSSKYHNLLCQSPISIKISVVKSPSCHNSCSTPSSKYHNLLCQSPISIKISVVKSPVCHKSCCPLPVNIIINVDKVNKGAKIRNRYNQVPHLTQDTNGKVTNSQ